MPTPAIDPFVAVADPTRRAILDRLRAGEAPVSAIAADFDMSRPAVSRHLRVLREARLVRDRPGADGRQRVYALTAEPLREVLEWTAAYQTFWRATLGSLKRHVEARAARHPLGEDA